MMKKQSALLRPTKVLFECEIEDHEGKVATLRVYKKRHYRWRLKRKQGGKIISAATQGYANKKDCLGNVKTVLGMWRIVGSNMLLYRTVDSMADLAKRELGY